MAYIVLPARNRRQPRGVVQLAEHNPLLDSIKACFVGWMPYIDLASGGRWTIGGAANPIPSAQGGRYFKLSGAAQGDSYAYQTIATPPASPGWTMASVTANLTAAQNSSGPLMGLCASPGSSTFDRQLKIASSTTVGSYLFDGTQQDTTTTCSWDNTSGGHTGGEQYCVASAGAGAYQQIDARSALGVYSTRQSFLSNTGYQGYGGSQALAIGNSSFSPANLQGIGVALVLFLFRPWSNSEIAEFLDYPYNVLRQKRRRLYFAATAAGGFNAALMAAMSPQWPITVITQPRVVASGMTPPDNIPK